MFAYQTSVSQAAPKPVTLKLVSLEPPTVFLSRSTRISPPLAHLYQHGQLDIQQGDLLPHQLVENSAPLPLLVRRWDGAGTPVLIRAARTSMQRLKAAATTGVDMAFPVARNTPALLIPANCSALNPCRAHRSIGCKHLDNLNESDNPSYCSSQMRSLQVRNAQTTP